MKIMFVWTATSDTTTAEMIAGPISREMCVPFMVVPPAHRLSEKRECLLLEAPGLGHDVIGDTHGANYCSKSTRTLEALKAMGVDAQIQIDGWNLIQFATQQEKLAAHRLDGMEAAIKLIKTTRSWFKGNLVEELHQLLVTGLRKE